MARTPEFPCILVGDVGTGKTSFVKRLLTGAFEKEYVATSIVEKDRLTFYTTRGVICFFVMDTGGHDKFSTERKIYCSVAQCAIIMFDVNSPETYENVTKFHRDIQSLCKNIPIAVVGNKIDKEDRIINTGCNGIQKQMNMQLHNISVKSNYNIATPFLWLAQQLIGDPTLEFVPQKAHMPLNIKVSKECLLQMALDFEKAQNVEISEDDEDL